MSQGELAEQCSFSQLCCISSLHRGSECFCSHSKGESITKKLQQEPGRRATPLGSSLASVVSGHLFLREHSMFIPRYFPQNTFPKGC